MGKYILKRVASGLLTLFIILTLAFFLMRIIGGNPVYHILDANDITAETVEEMTKELGLDKPLLVQYGNYLLGILRGDWGSSYFNYKGVFANMLDRWEPTIMIAVVALAFMIFVGIPLGVLGATKRNSPTDYAITTVTLFTQTLPSFWVALLMMIGLCFKLKLFPLGNYVRLEEGNVLETLRSVFIPALALSISSIGGVARQTRSTFLGVLKEDYIRTAKAKGLPRSKVLFKHGLKNAISLVTSMLTSRIAALLGGSIIIEKVFSIEGIGKLCLDSLNRRDYAQQQACILACAAIYVFFNIMQDIIYKLIDPRIDYNS